MFKFMKSKKGFSLVELMIVVVIMAILVAVAVPIYNAVTANARTKTCLDNQRTIINSLGNHLMLQGIQLTAATETFTISTNADGDGAAYTGLADAPAANAENPPKIHKGVIDAVFQTIPYCPESGSSIIVTVTKQTSDDGTPVISTQCTGGHQLNPGNS